MSFQELFGLDVGQSHIGIARASTAARLAEPLVTITTNEAIVKLQALIAENRAEALVVGLPRSLDGNDTAQTAWARQWVETAKEQINRPFYWQDEALTSQRAGNMKQETRNKIDEHSLAATIILQDFLDTPESERMKA